MAPEERNRTSALAIDMVIFQTMVGFVLRIVCERDGKWTMVRNEVELLRKTLSLVHEQNAIRPSTNTIGLVELGVCMIKCTPARIVLVVYLTVSLAHKKVSQHQSHLFLPYSKCSHLLQNEHE